jgi:hypothetical protein
MDGKMLSEVIMSEPHLAAIGMVVIESTYLEKFIERLIWWLCKVNPKQGKFLTARMLMDSRLDLLSDLAKPKIKDPSRRQVLTTLISDLKNVNNERNVVVHGLWTPQPKLPIAPSGIIEWEAIAIKERWKDPPLKMSPDQIVEVARSISSGYLDLASFVTKEWPKWPP